MPFVKGEVINGFPFSLEDIAGQPIISGTVTGYYLLDGGAQTVLSGTAAHEGNGQWSWSVIPATATNGNILGLLFLHAAGRASFTIHLVPAAFGAGVQPGFASEVAICNAALLELGDETITAFTDDSDRARACSALYAGSRDEVLEAFPWTFAIERVALAQLATAPTFGYAYAYQLPSNCLHVLEASEAEAVFHVEGRKVLTDESALAIRYIKRVEDPSQFTPGFISALTALLASKLAYPLTRNHTLGVDKYKLYEIRLQNAASIDGQSGTPYSLESTALTSVR